MQINMSYHLYIIKFVNVKTSLCKISIVPEKEEQITTPFRETSLSSLHQCKATQMFFPRLFILANNENNQRIQ